MYASIVMPAKDGKADSGDEKRRAPRKQNAGDDDDQQVERDEIAVLQSGGVHQRGNHDYVAGDLQAAVPRAHPESSAAR